MSLITKNNYEAYLLDYVEGNLSPELIADLMLFLENNPELKEDLDDFEIHELIPLKIGLSDKSQLKKEGELVTLLNYEELLIAEIEGLNSPEISNQLNLFLNGNSILKKQLGVYQNTRLVAPEIVFDEKKTLLRKESKVIPLYWWSSVAAAVIAILFWFNGFNNDVQKQYYPLVENREMTWEEGDDLSHEYILDDKTPKAIIVKSETPNKLKSKKANNTPVVEEKLYFASLPEESNNNVDTSQINEVNKSVNEGVEIQEKEVVYAENSVKITYEDEVLGSATVVPEKKKMTKLAIIRKAIKQEVKTKFFDKGRDRVMLAVNSKPINFIRGGKKKNTAVTN